MGNPQTEIVSPRPAHVAGRQPCQGRHTARGRLSSRQAPDGLHGRQPARSTGSEGPPQGTPPPQGARHEGAAEDLRLIGCTAAGDSDAFGALYDRYNRPVYSLALNVLRDPHAAQDVAQDVFAAIWTGARFFDASRGSVRAWILSLAHHKSVDVLRRRAVRAADPLTDDLIADADPAATAVQSISAAHVRQALRQLSAMQREAIALAYYRGYSQAEISERLGVPLGTIKTRMRDGMLRLRGLLQYS